MQGYDTYADPVSYPLGLDPMLLWYVVISAVIIAGLLFLFIQFLRGFLYIARPNEALVFSGQRYKTDDGQDVGFRIVKSGHRVVRIPLLEIVSRLDMTVIPVDIVVNNAYSRGNIPLEIHAIANVKVHSQDKFLRNAVERFLDKSRADIELVAQQTLEGALREVLAQLTPEEVNEDRLKFAEKLIQSVEDDLQILGLQLDTLKIQSVSDSTGYLDSIGRPKIAAALRDAENAENQATQEIQQAQSEMTRRAEVARAGAQTATQTKQNELRQVRAQLEGQAQSIEREAEAATKTARAMAERDLQGLRSQLEQRRLQVEVVIPAEFQRQAQTIIERGLAAQTIENGAAQVEVLKAMSDAWATMGAQARELYVIQHLDQIVGAVVNSMDDVKLNQVHIIDQGDGEALAGYAASYPKMVGAVMKSLRDSTGIDVTALLSGQGTTPSNTNPKA